MREKTTKAQVKKKNKLQDNTHPLSPLLHPILNQQPTTYPGKGLKIGFCTGDGRMGVVALIRKNTGDLEGAGHYNLCCPE